MMAPGSAALASTPDGLGTSLPTPGTRLDGARLHLWFGDEAHPALVLRPIDLDD